MPLPEDVADAAAGEDLQAATAHPHPEGELCKRGTRRESGWGVGEDPRLSKKKFFKKLQPHQSSRPPRCPCGCRTGPGG